ncbi:hypothetical protein K502DRAFT_342493 [Neoconidiobolus thromboides FSU 785]|nr:hypothetical protein K502DRAFT_342493 [Neoconidiobolus thromboides FSU 785]
MEDKDKNKGFSHNEKKYSREDWSTYNRKESRDISDNKEQFRYKSNNLSNKQSNSENKHRNNWNKDRHDPNFSSPNLRPRGGYRGRPFRRGSFNNKFDRSNKDRDYNRNFNRNTNTYYQQGDSENRNNHALDITSRLGPRVYSDDERDIETTSNSSFKRNDISPIDQSDKNKSKYELSFTRSSRLKDKSPTTECSSSKRRANFRNDHSRENSDYEEASNHSFNEERNHYHRSNYRGRNFPNRGRFNRGRKFSIPRKIFRDSYRPGNSEHIPYHKDNQELNDPKSPKSEKSGIDDKSDSVLEINSSSRLDNEIRIRGMSSQYSGYSSPARPTNELKDVFSDPPYSQSARSNNEVYQRYSDPHHISGSEDTSSSSFIRNELHLPTLNERGLNCPNEESANRPGEFQIKKEYMKSQENYYQAQKDNQLSSADAFEAKKENPKDTPINLEAEKKNCNTFTDHQGTIRESSLPKDEEVKAITGAQSKDKSSVIVDDTQCSDNISAEVVKSEFETETPVSQSIDLSKKNVDTRVPNMNTNVTDATNNEEKLNEINAQIEKQVDSINCFNEIEPQFNVEEEVLENLKFLIEEKISEHYESHRDDTNDNINLNLENSDQPKELIVGDKQIKNTEVGEDILMFGSENNSHVNTNIVPETDSSTQNNLHSDTPGTMIISVTEAQATQEDKELVGASSNFNLHKKAISSSNIEQVNGCDMEDQKQLEASSKEIMDHVSNKVENNEANSPSRFEHQKIVVEENTKNAQHIGSMEKGNGNGDGILAIQALSNQSSEATNNIMNNVTDLPKIEILGFFIENGAFDQKESDMIEPQNEQNNTEEEAKSTFESRYPFYQKAVMRNRKLRSKLMKNLFKRKLYLKQKSYELAKQYKSIYDGDREQSNRLAEKKKTRKRMHENSKGDGSISSKSQIGSFNIQYGDVVRSEKEFQEILASIACADLNQGGDTTNTTAIVPPIILDPIEKSLVTMNDSNTLILDPKVHYFKNANADHWEPLEEKLFIESYLKFPKQFGKIAAKIPDKTPAQCVLFYYRNKKKLAIKSQLERHRRNETLRARRKSTSTAMPRKKEKNRELKSRINELVLTSAMVPKASKKGKSKSHNVSAEINPMINDKGTDGDKEERSSTKSENKPKKERGKYTKKIKDKIGKKVKDLNLNSASQSTSRNSPYISISTGATSNTNDGFNSSISKVDNVINSLMQPTLGNEKIKTAKTRKPKSTAHKLSKQAIENSFNNDMMQMGGSASNYNNESRLGDNTNRNRARDTSFDLQKQALENQRPTHNTGSMVSTPSVTKINAILNSPEADNKDKKWGKSALMDWFGDNNMASSSRQSTSTSYMSQRDQRFSNQPSGLSFLADVAEVHANRSFNNTGYSTPPTINTYQDRHVPNPRSNEVAMTPKEHHPAPTNTSLPHILPYPATSTLYKEYPHMSSNTRPSQYQQPSHPLTSNEYKYPNAQAQKNIYNTQHVPSNYSNTRIDSNPYPPRTLLPNYPTTSYRGHGHSRSLHAQPGYGSRNTYQPMPRHSAQPSGVSSNDPRILQIAHQLPANVEPRQHYPNPSQPMHSGHIRPSEPHHAIGEQSSHHRGLSHHQLPSQQSQSQLVHPSLEEYRRLQPKQGANRPTHNVSNNTLIGPRASSVFPPRMLNQGNDGLPQKLAHQPILQSQPRRSSISQADLSYAKQHEQRMQAQAQSQAQSQNQLQQPRPQYRPAILGHNEIRTLQLSRLIPDGQRNNLPQFTLPPAAIENSLNKPEDTQQHGGQQQQGENQGDMAKKE